MGHTPGPWTIRPIDISTVGKFLQVVSDDYRQESDADHVVCELRRWRRPEPDADAVLIAAAPELLAACQAVANDCERILNGDDFSGMPDDELFGAFLNALRPAIAKAEGRSE